MTSDNAYFEAVHSAEAVVTQCDRLYDCLDAAFSGVDRDCLRSMDAWAAILRSVLAIRVQRGARDQWIQALNPHRGLQDAEFEAISA